MADVYTDWGKWRKTLAGAVNVGEKVGMGDETIIKTANKIGNFLTNKADPENPEQKILQDLWVVATEKEKHALASTIVKMVQKKEQ